MTRYVIIGNSAGSIGGIEAIRQVDRAGSLAVISEEPYPAYSRPQIARYLTGEVDIERTLFRPRSFYPAQQVELILGRAVVALDPARHIVQLNDGQEIPWDRLLLATGGTPIIPPVKGLEQVGYLTFMTLSDAQRLRERLPRMHHALIVGGGLIGLSVTEALCKLGVQTTVIELAPQILGRALDVLAAAAVQRIMESHGVRILTSCSLAEVRPVGAIQPMGTIGELPLHQSPLHPGFLAVLNNGLSLEADTLIMAIGVKPRLELAVQAGLSIGRGIVVDSHMRTSQPDLYACGDAAEAYDFIAGGPRLTPIWPNAYSGGRVAGLNMARQEAAYGGGTTMNALHFFDFPILSAGLVSPDPAEGCQIITHADGAGSSHVVGAGSSRPAAAESPRPYKKIVLREGKVVGFLFVGDIERAGVIYGLMKSKVDVASFAHKLLSDDFGFMSLPQHLRHELLGTGYVSPSFIPLGARENAVSDH